MIDSQELQDMRQRAAHAHQAVQLWALHRNGGMFGELPAEEAAKLYEPAAASAADVTLLLAVVESLRPAAYLHGHEVCLERECDHLDWETDPDGECPEVEERVATLGDVKRAEALDSLARLLHRCATTAERGGGVDDRDMAQVVIDTIDDAYVHMEADDDISEVVAPAGLIGAETAGNPHEGDQGHGGGA